MIARLRILLPFEVQLASDKQLAPIEFDRGDLHVTIYPPVQSKIDHRDLAATSPVPLTTLNQQLVPAKPQSTTGSMTMDTAPVVVADMLQIDFRRESFDRGEASQDPSWETCFEVANDFISKLRLITRGFPIRPVVRGSTMARLIYLNDDGSTLEPMPSVVRARGAATFQLSWIAVTQTNWDEVRALPPDYRAPVWDSLILDAVSLLAEVGAALVLANTAVEIRIADALDQLAGSAGLNLELWDWINDRGDYRKEPSVYEQYDKLMHALAGHSLKEKPDLWKAFTDMRKVRNAFAHGGRATLDGHDVSSAEANGLIVRALEIIDWVEEFLPESARRPKSKATVELSFVKMFVAGGPPQQPPGDQPVSG